MSAERSELRPFWPSEQDVVRIASETRLSPPDSNGGYRSVVAECVPPARRPPRLTAADFTPERMLRPKRQPPSDGWRRAVYVMSGRSVSIAPSAAELRRGELVSRLQTPIAGCRKVAFVSRKGGVGKTTTCLLVGHTFAVHRGGRIVALDVDPDAGTLGHRLRRESNESVATLLRDRQAIDRYADVRAYSSQASSSLEVIAGNDRSDVSNAIGRMEVGHAVGLLQRHYNLICLDTGAGLLGSAAQGALQSADQLVVVGATSLDTARAASATLDWLEEHGHRGLATSAVVALNAVRKERGDVDVARIEEHFASRCRACVRIPWDPHLEPGADAVLADLRPNTRAAFLELAAAIACGFTEPLERTV